MSKCDATDHRSGNIRETDSIVAWYSEMFADNRAPVVPGSVRDASSS
jgi:hypothetical protein